MNDQNHAVAPLLPCPFCGSRAATRTESICYGHGDYGQIFIVKCGSPDCGAEMRLYDYGHRSAECVQRWNRRPQADASASKCDSLNQGE